MPLTFVASAAPAGSPSASPPAAQNSAPPTPRHRPPPPPPQTPRRGSSRACRRRSCPGRSSLGWWRSGGTEAAARRRCRHRLRAAPRWGSASCRHRSRSSLRWRWPRKRVGERPWVAYLVLTCCRAECRGKEPKMWTEVVKCRSSATAAMSAGSLMWPSTSAPTSPLRQTERARIPVAVRRTDPDEAAARAVAVGVRLHSAEVVGVLGQDA